MEPFNFKQFWLAMSKEEREAFAAETGTTAKYIMVHTQRKSKIPGRPLMDKLFKACKKRKPELTKPQLVSFFY
ncbi:Uncharacterised protein [Serratia ficaria]|uniref:hypothetical protein n=1 Tax=Serratia ficaria TaxID=61651 RepID=UPI0021792D86|nr:hypothetical protein [Serratia ficaria]CAI1023362.1 Uncharacterised protein [Serratia ficaria]CAI1860361.1 Uncharacterised protein [Serratia ficaria]CAI2471962.1 Uncharacterised protein [Serratia ficaria]